jgi:hypothetical protein
LNSIRSDIEAKVRKFSAAIKSQAASGNPDESELLVLSRELQELDADYRREEHRVLQAIGISEAEIEAIERAHVAEALPSGKEYWHHQIFQFRATEDLDAHAAVGLERLLRKVDLKWLQKEAQKTYRLGPSFLTHPLHLVSGVRVDTTQEIPGPQRFARMLLLCEDHLEKKWELDFFAAAMFVPEVAILGKSLEEIASLGPEAERKLSTLSLLTDDKVTATVFELLVGAACVRRGLKVHMVPEDRSGKVPDYRITGLSAFPCAIECKRRLGLVNYELDEARRVEALYEAIRPTLQDKDIHCSIEVSFRGPLHTISPKAFFEDVFAAVSRSEDQESKLTRWGSLAVRRLPYCGSVPVTRLYSPDFLQQVFGWDPLQTEWDGLLCEVEAPLQIDVKSFRMPRCLKWRSESEEALTKKARGITSLWADAVKQIPDGEIGFVYIAYPEGARAAIADARTRQIIKSMNESWHRWSVRVPVTVISRLYPRPVGVGCPDLIESSLPGTTRGQEFWLTDLPKSIFTHQFE